MKLDSSVDYAVIRGSLAKFDLTPKVLPNERIELHRAFFPDNHRGVLDLKRPLVVGNRGMGKSFWTHALLNDELRERLASVYRLPALGKTQVVIGFNGSEKLNDVAPTTDEISDAIRKGIEPDLIWRAVLLRGARLVSHPSQSRLSFENAVKAIKSSPNVYSETLSKLDDNLRKQNKTLLIVFDALDRLARDWNEIRSLTKDLLARVVGLQSYQAIRSKIFMRVDQFGDQDLFRFPDSSKIMNDHVDLKWQAADLYGLLLFEILRVPAAAQQLKTLARETETQSALPVQGTPNSSAGEQLDGLISAMAGEYMGRHKKRGRVFTWIPLHLSDAANACSPRVFLTAWKAAAEASQPTNLVVDHIGLLEGVRKASAHRLQELREDYPWIDKALEALRGHFVPIIRNELFAVWTEKKVSEEILAEASLEPRNAPVGLIQADDLSALLDAMKNIAVMEERANGKINVPDIFRIEAGIMRKGGVAVPRKAARVR